MPGGRIEAEPRRGGGRAAGHLVGVGRGVERRPVSRDQRALDGTQMVHVVVILHARRGVVGVEHEHVAVHQRGGGDVEQHAPRACREARQRRRAGSLAGAGGAGGDARAARAAGGRARGDRAATETFPQRKHHERNHNARHGEQPPRAEQAGLVERGGKHRAKEHRRKRRGQGALKAREPHPPQSQKPRHQQQRKRSGHRKAERTPHTRNLPYGLCKQVLYYTV